MKNNKKAFIDQIMLGFFLFAMIFVFIATVSDEQKARDEVLKIKQVVQSVALASAKYYVQNEDTDEAKAIALGIASQTKLGKKIKDNLTFTWVFDEEPNYIKVKVENYQIDYFWYRLLGLNSVDIDKIETKVNIIVDDIPISINGCGKTFTVGQTYDFVYRETNIFNSNHHFAFYNKFAINAVNSFSTDVESFLNLDNFIGQDINIEVLDCDGTQKEIIPVHINEGSCAKGCCSISFWGGFSFGGCNFIMSMMCSMFQMFENFTQDMFSDLVWANATTENCEDANLFRINFTILDSNVKKVILEY